MERNGGRFTGSRVCGTISREGRLTIEAIGQMLGITELFLLQSTCILQSESICLTKSLRKKSISLI